ncbi:MAG: tetratricopeptide repeat protein [Candidatus Palauibacterales bacterium]|nr:tetratricopeptide repeat protein [Candidatus Palauibacterales bacterium]MDP2483742.1 tetratricopeptide repeat protein [Candidatus Palauibacterales bacterium]
MANTTHKNSLWKVLGLYAAGSWVVLQVVDVLAQNADLPGWVFNLALILLIIGLPIVGATAYLHGLGGRTEAKAASAAAGTRGARTGTLGLFTWKNAIGGGIGAMALWGVLVTGWLFFGPGPSRGATDGSPAAAADVASPSDLRSVAVLPFTTRAREGDEDAVIFADGMQDDVLTQLSKIDSLTVISRTSVMQYAGTTKPIPEIARELGVATILEGGIQRSGDRVRVNVQLIEASTDRHLWAETYDEELTAANVFAIQSDLAKKIAGALKAKLAPEIEARIDAKPTESLEAYDLYSRGQYVYWGVRGNTTEGMEEARDLYEAAVAADSTYAAAWVGLADTYQNLSSRGIYSLAEGSRMAWEAVDRALALDPDLAEAHSRRGLLLWFDRGRPEEAEDELLKALELNPGSSVMHIRYSNLLNAMGRDEEAVAETRRALELDPMDLRWRITLADRLFYAGDYEESLAEARRVIEMEPRVAGAHYNAAYALAMLGRYGEAIQAFKKAHEIDPSQASYATALAWGWALAGERDSALAALVGVPEDGDNLKEIAIVYGALGDLDTAFEYIDRLVEEAPQLMRQFTSDPTADPLKADPRYQRALERAGVE